MIKGNDILSQHPLSKVSYMMKTQDPDVVCYIAKNQEKGTIKDLRACFFVKLRPEDNQDDVLNKFSEIVSTLCSPIQ